MSRLHTLDRRFWSKVLIDNGCWLWQGSRTSKDAAYGYYHVANRPRRRTMIAHRYAYTQLRGTIADGLVLHHKCETPLCVNPWHLEPTTHQRNILIGRGASARCAGVTHCPRGHEYNAENTYIYRGSRQCKECRRAHNRAYHARRMAR
jgi:hypothetical protein